jgi:hypothetical protein
MPQAMTVYFDRKGPENTDETLRLALERAEQLDIRDVVVASHSGATGAKASRVFEGRRVVAVAGVVGFREPNEIRLREEHRAVIEAHGGSVLFAGHAFGMLGRAVNKKFCTIQVDELIAHTLRVLGEGVKVGCEIACMAADAGLIRAGQETIAIGGSEDGADTALVIRASNTHTFFDTRILEIICKPRG